MDVGRPPLYLQTTSARKHLDVLETEERVEFEEEVRYRAKRREAFHKCSGFARPLEPIVWSALDKLGAPRNLRRVVERM